MLTPRPAVRGSRSLTRTPIATWLRSTPATERSPMATTPHAGWCARVGPSADSRASWDEAQGGGGAKPAPHKIQAAAPRTIAGLGVADESLPRSLARLGAAYVTVA